MVLRKILHDIDFHLIALQTSGGLLCIFWLMEKRVLFKISVIFSVSSIYVWASLYFSDSKK